MNAFPALVALVCSCVAIAAVPEYSLDDGSGNRSPQGLRFARESIPAPDENTRELNVTVNHRYYQSRYYPNGSSLFLDVTQLNDGNTQHHVGLSTKYTHAVTARLRFAFPYYGHLVRSIVVTTGGFLFVGPSWHRFVTQTHYIAPLMANFNPNVSSISNIYLYNTSDVFIAQWDKVVLDDQKSHGTFTFQTQLYPNGSVVFAYKDIPSRVSNFSTANHPVRVGLSNAFIRNIKIAGLRFREIVRYHTIALPLDIIKSNTAFRITEVPTCVTARSCAACLSGQIPFRCKWCNKLQLCSDSVDWFNQKWIDSGCQRDAITNCSQSTTTSPLTMNTTTSPLTKNTTASPLTMNTATSPLTKNTTASPLTKKRVGLSSSAKGGLVVAVIILLIIIAIAAFLAWAYLHPTSPYGMMLIKYRPKKWFSKNESKA